MRLFPRDTDRVLRILPELYTHATTDDFLKRTFYLLGGLVDADHIGWTVAECTHTLRLTKVVADSDQAPLLLQFANILQEAFISHPYGHYFRPDQRPTAIMLSDIPKQVSLAYLSRYEGIHRALDLHYQLTLPLVSPDGSLAAVSLNRSTRHFAERDRDVLNVLQPHIHRAYANAQLIDRGDDPRQVRQACEEGFGLTAREAEIAFWIAQGKTNAEIGTILKAAPRTVEKHVEHVLEKLGVENRVAACLRIQHWSTARLTTASSEQSYYAGSILIEAA